MSRFATEWLALREPVDSRSRARRLVDALREHAAGAAIKDVIDLGAGTGAALRYLAPRLGGVQRWQLVDADALALAAARRELAEWARRRGAEVSGADNGIELRGAGLACAVRLVEADVGRGFAALDWADGAIVSASALLDLVSADWLDALVAKCAVGRNPAWLTLSFDGRIELDPADAFDAHVRDAFARDQRRDKGLGPALGPSAAQRAAEAFAAAGFRVASEPSDWLLGPEAAGLSAALVAGYADVASRADPASANATGHWQRRRAEQITAGTLTVRVGHVDLLALPHGEPEADGP